MTRQEYMDASRDDGAKAHRIFYAQFVNAGTIRAVVSAIGEATLLASRDPHLNNIPIATWDRVGAFMPLACSFASLGDHKSLAGLVCIAKEAARQFIDSKEVK